MSYISHSASLLVRLGIILPEIMVERTYALESTILVWILHLSCVTLGEFLSLSDPHFCHL